MAEGENKPRQVAMVAVAAIDMGERLRDLDPVWVEILTASLGEEGLYNPIEVTEADAQGRHRVVAGAHRLAAARALAWKKIPAFLFSGGDLDATLRQIDENLLRRDLVALDRAVFLARRKRVYEAMHPETRHGGPRLGYRNDHLANIATCMGPRAERFSKVAARRLGGGERSLQMVIARGLNLAPDVARLLGPSKWAQNGRALDRIGELEGREQREVAIALTRPENPARNFDAALAEARGEPTLPRRERDNPLFKGWERATLAERQAFLQWALRTQIKGGKNDG